MNITMTKQDAVKYTNEVKNYVTASLGAALSAEVDGDVARTTTNLELLKRILADTELRDEIRERITNYGVQYSMVAYKINLEPELREMVFMRKIYDFLSFYQISLLAVHFDKQITAEKSEKHSR